jgi:hypothetical protein
MIARPTLLACCFAVLAGCQGIRVLDHSLDHPNVPAKSPILLFEETEAAEDTVKQVILRHVPPGTPIAQAQTALAKQGFTCRPYSAWTMSFYRQALIPSAYDLSLTALKRVHEQRERIPIFCHVSRPELMDWGLRSHEILVVLIPDEKQVLRDVEVGVRNHFQSDAQFFLAKPDFHEPVGLPIAEAQSRMEAAGFRCTLVEAKAGAESRRHLFCRTFDEHALGGSIIRVHLYPDEAGVVRETRILDETGWFDAERCMLPGSEDTSVWAVAKGALFPVRVGCRYTLISAGYMMCVLAISGTAR